MEGSAISRVKYRQCSNLLLCGLFLRTSVATLIASAAKEDLHFNDLFRYFKSVLRYRTKSRIWLHNWSVNDRLATFLECAQAELFQFLRRLCRQIHGNSAIEITVGKKEIHLKSANKIQSLAASRFNCFTHAHAPAIWHSIRNWIHEPFSASHSFMFRIKFPTISKFVQYLVCWTFWCIILLTFKWYQINILQHKLLCNHLKREVW